MSVSSDMTFKQGLYGQANPSTGTASVTDAWISTSPNTFFTSTGTTIIGNVGYTSGYVYRSSPPFMKAIISSEVLFKLSKSGRNVLGYVIDKAMQKDNEHVVLDTPSITEYLVERIEKKQANYYNVRRGIKDLEANLVIFPVKDAGNDVYKINPDKIQHLDQPITNSFVV
jgi:hypothetical protein